MSSSTVSCFVVVAGATSVDDERVFCEVVGKYLNDIGGPLDQLERCTIRATDKGVVEIIFSDASGPLINDARRMVMLYLRAQGLRVLDNRPDARAKPDHTPAAAKAALVAATSQLNAEPVTMADALLIEDVLTIIAGRGATPSHDIAELLKRPVEAIDRLLGNLTLAGLVAGNVASVFTLTDVGVIESSAYKGGRKAVVEALLAHGSLSTYALAEIMDCTLTVPKKSVRRLISEGMVEPAGHEPASGGGQKPRRTFQLTQHGAGIGHGYMPLPPGPKKMDWNDPTPRQLAVMQALLSVVDPLTASGISQDGGVPVRSVTDILRGGCEQGYVERQVLQMAPLTYGYALTRDGRTVAERAIAEYTVANTSKSAVRTYAYRLSISGEIPEAAELLRQLEALEGVTLEPLDAI